MERGRDNPGVRFPGPVYYASGFLLGLLLERLAPLGNLPAFADLLSLLLLLPALALLYTSLALFLKAKTSPLPMRPARTLLTTGPYRWTRNPIYLAMALLYAGVALLFDVPWALVLLPLVVWMIQRLVIAREEAYLERRFGETYRAYTERVRRWI